MWEEWGGGVENPVDAILLKVFFDRPIIVLITFAFKSLTDATSGSAIRSYQLHLW